MITEYTRNEYCDMLLTLGACNSGVGTAAWEHKLRYLGQLHPPVTKFDATILRHV